MNLKLRHLLLSKQTISSLSRLNPRTAIVVPHKLTNNQTLNHNHNAPTTTIPIPNPPCCSLKSFHSSPELKFSGENALAVVEDSDNVDDDEENEDSAAMNEFLSRFVHRMRMHLNEAYPNFDKQSIDAMLVLIVEKLVAQMDKGERLEDMEIERRSDLSEDLWRVVFEVSNVVYEEMEREKKKEKMKKYLQSEGVKAMARFASEVGVRGDMLRELRFKWAREAMEESEFGAELERIREEVLEVEEGGNVENGGDRDGIDNGNGDGSGLPKRHGKIKYKLYGIDLSGSKWKEVADKIHETGEMIWPQEAKEITGKRRLVTEKILAMRKDNVVDDELSALLDEWKKLLEPKRVDWMSLLEKLKERDVGLYLKVAEHVLGEPSFQADIRDYSKLVDIHAKENQCEDVDRILKKMTDNGMPPDIITLVTLVKMYSKAGNLERAKEAFETLRSHGYKADLQLYSTMIMSYVSAGQPKAADALLKRLETRDIKPTEEIYMSLLRGFAQRGDAEGAQRIETTMRFSGYDPTFESYTLLVEAYGKSGNSNAARNIFDHMMKVGFKPSDRCTAVMISAYEKKNELDKALNLLLELEKDGFQPGVSTYCALMDWFGKLELVDEAEQIVGKIAQLGEAPPFKIHVIRCDMYSRAGIEKKALQALGVLEAKKELLEHEDFERVINGLVKGGFMQDAKRTLGLMEAQGFTVSEELQMKVLGGNTRLYLKK